MYACHSQQSVLWVQGINVRGVKKFRFTKFASNYSFDPGGGGGDYREVLSKSFSYQLVPEFR